MSAAVTVCVSQTAGVYESKKERGVFFLFNPAWMSGEEWSGGHSQRAQRPTRSAAHTHFHTHTHILSARGSQQGCPAEAMETHTHALCLCLYDRI